MAFCRKIEPFLIEVFHRNSMRKHRFWYCGKKRMILSIKNWSFKKLEKMDLFPKELLHGFCPKFEISRMGVFYKNYVTKNRFSIFWIENKHSKTKKIWNWIFVHGVLFKNRTFSYRRFSEKFDQKTWFLILWKEKNDCMYKKLKFWKGPKNRYFPKELLYGFCPKFELFLPYHFHRNHIGKDRFWYCRKKKIILSTKNWSFTKGQKMDIF